MLAVRGPERLGLVDAASRRQLAGTSSFISVCSLQASQQLALGLSLLAVASAVGALFGYASGWTRYHSESFNWPQLHREAPVSIDIR